MTLRKPAGAIGAFALLVGVFITAAPPHAVAQPDCSRVKEARNLRPGGQVKVPAACLKVGSRVVIAGSSMPVPPDGVAHGMYNVLAPGGIGVDVEIENAASETTMRALDGAADSSDAEAAAAATASPSGCQDPAYSWGGAKNDGFDYYVAYDRNPSNVSFATFDSEINYAQASVRGGRNVCGLTTNAWGANAVRKGATTGQAMNTDGSCASDSADEIDFGTLPDRVLGRACTTTGFSLPPLIDKKISEADVRLNAGANWYQTIPTNCFDAYEIAGVLTHEFGHVFGMKHVTEEEHGNLLMSTIATPCSYADHSLGLGDYNNMADHY